MTMQMGKQMSMLLRHSTDAGGLYQASFSLSSPPSKVGVFFSGEGAENYILQHQEMSYLSIPESLAQRQVGTR